MEKSRENLIFGIADKFGRKFGQLNSPKFLNEMKKELGQLTSDDFEITLGKYGERRSTKQINNFSI